MRAVKSVVVSGLALALVAGSPVALGQNGRRDRREQQQAERAAAPTPNNDRRQRSEAPAPAPAPTPQQAAPPRPSAPPPSMPQAEAPRQRYVAPSAPRPTPSGGFDRRQRSTDNSQPTPQPAPTPRGNFTPAPLAPQAEAPAPAPSPPFERTRNGPRVAPSQPNFTNNDRRRVRESSPVAPSPQAPAPEVSRPPAPQAAPQAEASRRGPRVELPPRGIQGGTGDRIATPPDARRDWNGARGDQRDGRGDFRGDFSGDRRGDRNARGNGRDNVTIYSASNRDYGYANRRPVEIHRPRTSLDLSIVIGSGGYVGARYGSVCEPVRVVCPPVAYCPPRRHWYRPVWDSCSWDRWCEPRYVYNPYTLFPAPLWPGPSYTYASWPYYSGSSLGFSLFTYGSSSRYSGSFFYSTSLPLYTSSTYYNTGFYDTGTPWYSASSPSAVETFRTDTSPSLSQAVSTPADTGTGAIRVLTDAAPPAAAGAVANSAGFSSTHKPASVTIYRASDYGGTLAWNDSPTNIIYAVTSAQRDSRGEVAGQFLGRSPGGAWEVTYEKWRRTAIGPELTCRAALPNEAGWRATVIIRLKDAAIDPVERLRAGQRLSISGFLSEVSIDDPNHPGGLLILEDGKMSQ